MTEEYKDKDEHIGTRRVDFLVEDSAMVELKSVNLQNQRFRQ